MSLNIPLHTSTIDSMLFSWNCRKAFGYLGLCSLFILGCGKSPFSDLEQLPAKVYLEQPGDFLGNTYLLNVQIDSQIKWDKSVGRILSVKPEQGGARLPVFVPESVEGNLHIGQRYKMRVLVEEGGLLYVEALRKY